MRGFLIPHTHWDREWYKTFQQFRFKLVRLVDQLLEIMEADPDFKYFTLDGQAVVVEDYLEIKPENRARLESLIKEGRIVIGPWYVLPDEFLVSAESLLRNLMRGITTCREYGGAMMVGYVPDQFGHIEQLPQIFKGFGIEEAVMWRGVGSELQTNLFDWEAPDGTRLTGVYLADSYGNASNLPKDADEFKEKIAELVEKQRKFLANDAVLFMNGSDHLMPQPHLPALLKETAGELEVEMVFASLLQYIAALTEAATVRPLIKGEFRSGERAPLLVSCASSRIGQKQHNHQVENLLEKYAEPLSVWRWLNGNSYPAGYLRKSWELILKNHPHDSICGCSCDQVHREIDTRFDWSEQIAEVVKDEGFSELAAKVDGSWLGDKAGVVVYNPHPHALTALVEVELPETAENPVALMGAQGELIPLQTIDSGAKTYLSTVMSPAEFYDMLASLESRDFVGLFLNKYKFSPPQDGVVKADILLGWEHAGHLDINDLKSAALKLARNSAVKEIHITARDGGPKGIFLARDLPGCGWDSYALASEGELPVSFLTATAAGLESSLYKITINDDGSFDLFDRENGVQYRGLNQLVDGADCGDLYTFSTPPGDRLINKPYDGSEKKAEVEVLEKGPVRAAVRIKGEYILPATLTEDRQGRSERTVSCPYTVTLRITADSPGVHIDTVFENNAKNHRLRAHFPAPFNVEQAYADGHFAVTQRPVQPTAADYSNWAEKPHGLAPHKNFVSIDDGNWGLAVINSGLPEYEVLNTADGSEIALTLVRSVGWISRGDLAERPVHAGPAVETPEGQCPGTHHFKYCVVPHKGSWLAGKIKGLSTLFNAPPLAAGKIAEGGSLPARHSMLSINPPEVDLSCVKQSEDGKDVIVRLYNCSPAEEDTVVETGFDYRQVAAVNFLEEKVDSEVRKLEGKVSFKLRPYQIMTLRFFI